MFTHAIGTPEGESRNGSLPVVFCDFDGTITKKDAVDQLLVKYANPRWQALEDLWAKGCIGSRECLEQQIACIGHFTHDDLNAFVHDIDIDTDFIPFVEYIQAQRIPIYVVSDGFDLLIRPILERQGIRDIPLFCNRMTLIDNRLSVSFPLGNPECKTRSGVCKCRVMENVAADAHIVYVGDGRSDLCASRKANTLFAKGDLISYCQQEKREFITFDTFGDVLREIKQRGMHVAEFGCAVR